MRVRVDHLACEANGVCEDIVGEVFHLRDDDVLEILLPRPPAELEDDVRKAVAGCPKVALSIVDE